MKFTRKNHIIIVRLNNRKIPQLTEKTLNEKTTVSEILTVVFTSRVLH